MRRWILLALLAALVPAAIVSCGDDDGSKARPDAGTPTTPTTSPTGTSAPPDAGAGARRTSCLDRPNQLARPSTGLPCELIPPGLTL